MESDSNSLKNDKESLEKDRDKDMLIKELEEKLHYQQEGIARVNAKLSQALDRLSELRQEKEELQSRLEEWEHKKLDFKLQKHEKLEQEYHKMSHRAQVTKNQLDELRREIIFLNKVISDLEERGLIDYIKKRYPPSFIQYKNKK